MIDNIRSYNILSIHENFSIPLVNHTSVASKCFCIPDKVLHISQSWLVELKSNQHDSADNQANVIELCQNGTNQYCQSGLALMG